MRPISIEELHKFIGCMLLIGLFKGKNSRLNEFFTLEYGIPIIRENITYDRCRKIIRVLRFDILSRRNKQDRIPPIRLFFEKIIMNFQKSYVPNLDLTIDEQLVTFRGRCRFKMYIPSKPGSYGIKIWAMCDSRNSYLYNAKIYAGKIGEISEKNQGENIVKELSIPILKSGRNITMDNFFTTHSLARYFLSQNITVVGTVRKNKKFLPISFQSSKGNENDVNYIYQKDLMIIKYNQKKNKSVVLLSTQHSRPDINDSTKKPEIIHYHNSNKSGVDTLDQLIRCYSCKRASKRWPMAIFFNMIDIVAYNAFILFTQKNPQYIKKYKNKSRR